MHDVIGFCEVSSPTTKAISTHARFASFCSSHVESRSSLSIRSSWIPAITYRLGLSNCQKHKKSYCHDGGLLVSMLKIAGVEN
jgi:hypothetical protein